MPELSLTVTKLIDAPIESVYKAWLDPVMLARFMIPGSNMSVPKVAVDARRGGRFDIVMASGDKEIPHGGVYQTLQPFSKIIFTWESPMSIEGSTVTLNFTESKGKTHLELVHVKFTDEEACQNHQNGWTSILEHLSKMLTSLVTE